MAEASEAMVWVDGLCERVTPGGKRNPGGLATYGWVIEAPGLGHVEGKGIAARPGPWSTNNVAEYTAAIEALRHLGEVGWDKPVRLHSDSQLLIYQLRGLYRVSSARIQPFYHDALMAARPFPGVTWTWIPREQNERADQLSRDAFTAEVGHPP